MEFQLTDQQEGFRADVCSFLTKELTQDVRQSNHDPSEQGEYKWPFVKEFRKKLAKRGYLGIGWPKEYGGGGRDMLHQVLFFEEMDYHGAPSLSPSYTYLPMGIILFGTEEQKSFFLPRLSSGDMDFFQGYSEPEAGSDLANLQCRAVAEGDEFVVNGQKLFSSKAHHSEWAFMLVRTNPDVRKHRGISMLLIDMHSPGITLGWYKTMAGWWHHGVHFDDVRVPRSNLLGELDQGWYHGMAILDYERAANGNPGAVMALYDQLLAYCNEIQPNGHSLIEESHVSNLLAELASEVQTARLTAYWVASMHANGEHPEGESTLVTLVMRETARKIDAAALDLLGPYANLWRGSKWAPLDGEMSYNYINNTYFSFAAGGFDISRNVIANRGLQLPRG